MPKSDLFVWIGITWEIWGVPTERSGGTPGVGSILGRFIPLVSIKFYACSTRSIGERLWEQRSHRSEEPCKTLKSGGERGIRTLETVLTV